jgi:putative mRNA 3-end processing factor
MDLGVEPVRRVNGRGRPSPHLSVKFDFHIFSIDTSRSPQRSFQPDAYLITHAHSDHYGKSAMLSERGIASEETARALEIRYGKKYKGRTFKVGEKIEVNGVEIETFTTGHTIGSAAFLWKNEVGTRTLVTGDVKDYRALPKCDFLISEANYGDPCDKNCIFDDDLLGFSEALETRAATFGAYAFGKAQRAVALIRAMGYKGEIGMDAQSLALTEALMADRGPFAEVSDGLNVVTPWNLSKVKGRNKYVLTGRNDYYYPTIRLSDHLDFRGLMKMIEHVNPQEILVYHPGGQMSNMLAQHLQQQGMKATALDGIEKFLP